MSEINFKNMISCNQLGNRKPVNRPYREGNMRKIRSFLIALLLAIPLSSSFAVLPVIDVPAITNAVMNFAQTVEQYNRQIKQWKADYDRIQKAAVKMASGDWDSALSGLSDILSTSNRYTGGLDDIMKVVSDTKRATNSVRQSVQFAQNAASSFNSLTSGSFRSFDDVLNGTVSLSELAAASTRQGAYFARDILTLAADSANAVSLTANQAEAVKISDKLVKEQSSLASLYREMDQALASGNTLKAQQLENSIKIKEKSIEEMKENLNTIRDIAKSVNSRSLETNKLYQARMSEYKESINDQLRTQQLLNNYKSIRDRETAEMQKRWSERYADEPYRKESKEWFELRYIIYGY